MGRVPGVVKWVVSPALAALLGYSVIGPRFAGHPRIVKAVQEGVSKVIPQEPRQTSVETPAVDEPSKEPSKPVPPPEVSVTAKPADKPPAEEKPKPRRRRRRRHRAAPVEEAPPETTPSAEPTGPDPASTPP